MATTITGEGPILIYVLPFADTNTVAVTFPVWAANVDIKANGGVVNVSSSGTDTAAPTAGRTIADGGAQTIPLSVGPVVKPAKTLYFSGASITTTAELVITAGGS